MTEDEAGAFWSPARPSARRSLILCALGALIGLAIAGLGLFTAKGTRTAAVPAEDVALVNQTPILVSDFGQQLRALYDVSPGEATPAQKRKVLDAMIREELFVQRGVELGLQSDTTEVREALVGATEAQTAADARMSEPDEAELRAYYRRHRDAFTGEGTIELADHLLPRDASLAAVTAARAALVAAGADDIAANRAAPRSGRMTQGSEFYFAARIHLGDRLFDAVKGLKAGEVSPPVMLPDGIHIVAIRKNIVPIPEPFEAARDRVLAAYVDAQEADLIAANERFLRKRADIQLAPGYE